MLRAAVAKKTPLGLEAKKAMDTGALVTDDIVVGLIEESIQVHHPPCFTPCIGACFVPDHEAPRSDCLIAAT